jgi:hypothetical protein
MQNTLRSLVIASLAVTASLFTAKAASAATLDVPFAFMVGNKVCPAGQYTVRTDDLGSSVELLGGQQGFKWIVHPGDPAPTDHRVVMKFVSVGSQHVLRSIQYGPMITSKLDKGTRESVFARGDTGITIGTGQ